jgi:2-polyprenyl-6-methoxyphenol hydroxylase-like FAD-dependent oxidoreductase
MKVLVIGGGIGGLATALSLHAAGIECAVFEQSRSIRELGVGINILPHAVRELASLDLLDALDRVAIRTRELIYANRFGQKLWHEPRGLDAGYDYPQFSIHRGKLQGVLYAAARARIGEDAILVDHQLRELAQDEHGVTATFMRRTGSDKEVTARGDVLIAADGIHSTVRRTFYRDEGPAAWNGVMMWRGAVEYPPFLTGRSMLIAGGMKTKLVLYPISNQTSKPGTNLLNWVVAAKVSDGAEPPPRRDDWNRLGRLDELLPHAERVSRISIVHPMKIIRATKEIYEYPMCDRDPLPRWSFGRVTLLGTRPISCIRSAPTARARRSSMPAA